MAEENNSGGGPWIPQANPGSSGNSQNPPQRINQQTTPDKNIVGTGEGESPLARPNDIKFDLRTMSSDIASIKESGGGAPRPYVPPPPIRPREEALPTGSTNLPQTGFGQARPSAPPPGIAFKSDKAPSTFSAPQPKPAIIETKPTSAKKSSGWLFYAILAVVLVAGLATIGYFFVYPSLFGEKAGTTPETEAPITMPPPQTETPPPVVETPTPPQTPVAHVSLFKIPADETNSELVGDFMDGTFLRSVIQNETSATSKFKEVVLTKSDGGLFETSDLFSALFPSLEASSFENDPTVFVHVAPGGSHPGLALKAKSGVSLENLKTVVSQIESSNSIVNLFLSDPPASSGVWKSGMADGVATRYVVLGNGFAFNYGWVGDVLVMSASYDGFREAVRRLR